MIQFDYLKEGSKGPKALSLKPTVPLLHPRTPLPPLHLPAAL